MPPKVETLSTFEFFRKFPDEETARKVFEMRRWGGEPVCGHCGSLSVTECKDHKPMPYRCKDCRAHFSVRTGTVLAESRLPFLKWLLAIYLLTSASKGIPLTQMARELDITQKSAWFLAQRIREVWLKSYPGEDNDMDDLVQVDETFIDGRQMEKHENKKLHISHRGKGKTTVVGMRDQNEQVCVVPVENTKAKVLKDFISANAPVGATVITDQYCGYLGFGPEGFTHKAVKHSFGE